MGISWIRKIRAAEKINMKFFVVVSALVAVACAEAEPKPEADPALLYNGVYSPLTYGAFPFSYRTPYSYGVSPYTYHHFGKRSADAEPEADAALLYTGAYSPLTYGAFPYGYRTAYTYGASPYTFGAYHHFGKRSADAEPEADAALLYSGVYSPLTYGAHAYGPYAYGYAGHHALAATPFGLTHSSNVGLCFNNVGARVSC